MNSNGHFSNSEPKTVKLVITVISAIIVVIVALAFIRPWYNVWSQEMEGKAEFERRSRTVRS